MMEYAKNSIINPLLPSPRINSYNYIGIFDFYLETVKNHIEWNSPPLPFLFLLPYTPPQNNDQLYYFPMFFCHAWHKKVSGVQ